MSYEHTYGATNNSSSRDPLSEEGSESAEVFIDEASETYISQSHLSLVVSENDTSTIFDTLQDWSFVNEQWQDRALCAQTDPEAFFPEKGGSTREAKKICQRCPVRSECLEYALAHDERFGIWGGLSERERRRLKRGIN